MDVDIRDPVLIDRYRLDIMATKAQAPRDTVTEIVDEPGDGVVAAADVTSTDPETFVVRANVHTLGLDAGDIVEMEITPVTKGLVDIGHFTVMKQA